MYTYKIISKNARAKPNITFDVCMTSINIIMNGCKTYKTLLHCMEKVTTFIQHFLAKGDYTGIDKVQLDHVAEGEVNTAWRSPTHDCCRTLSIG